LASVLGLAILGGIVLILQNYMRSKIGQAYFAREKRVQYLRIPMEGAVEYGEATAELIDTGAREITNV